jgi:hypothetical protein
MFAIPVLAQEGRSGIMFEISDSLETDPLLGLDQIDGSDDEARSEGEAHRDRVDTAYRVQGAQNPMVG